MSNDMSAPTPPPAGWYPDPSGKPGQMFWDGQRWRTDSTPPAAATAPWDRAHPYMDTARPHMDKARHFWSGLSRNAKLLVAGGAALAAVVVVILAVVLIGAVFGGSAGRSSAYQAGYDKGVSLQGSEVMQNGGDMAIDIACFDFAFSSTSGEEAKHEYEQGCKDGFREGK